MNQPAIYNELKEILALAWQDDDSIRQETLFELQEKLANLTLQVARGCGEHKLKDLVKSFPYLYSMK